jgi:hypothetical protein
MPLGGAVPDEALPPPDDEFAVESAPPPQPAFAAGASSAVPPVDVMPVPDAPLVPLLEPAPDDVVPAPVPPTTSPPAPAPRMPLQPCNRPSTRQNSTMHQRATVSMLYLLAIADQHRRRHRRWSVELQV